MSVRFEIDYSEVEKLQEKFAKITGEVEQIINDFLHKTGVEIVTRDILSYTPISGRNKVHARQSNSLQSTKLNLGFEIKPRTKFKYLVFPDRALGINRGLLE